MEVRPGYKQTDVGVIPEDWDVVPIGQLFSFKNGLNKAKKFFGHGTPIVNYMDVYGRPALLVERIAGRVDVSPKELSAYNVRKGDVFFTRTSETVEEIGIASVMLDDPENTVYSGFVLRGRPTNNSLADAFKAYCFSPRYFRQQITARASYTTRALTNGRSLSAAILARPRLPEQRLIATALSDVDALLGGLDWLIAKKHDLKQAAMQQLLSGQTRLPGFRGEWEVKPLGDLCGLKSGQGITAKNIDGVSPFPCYGGNGLRGFTSRFTHDGSYALIGRQGALCGNVFGVEGQFFASEHAVVVTASENTDIRWLTYVLGNMNLNQYSESSAQPGLSVTKLLNLELAAPPTKDEQTAIATVLSDVAAELTALEARRNKIRDLKQAMMQVLLTGKTRLVPAGAAHA
jgi:type I restriction enzyme, S subunit